MNNYIKLLGICQEYELTLTINFQNGAIVIHDVFDKWYADSPMEAIELINKNIIR
jgi:hypothetical protein